MNTKYAVYTIGIMPSIFMEPWRMSAQTKGPLFFGGKLCLFYGEHGALDTPAGDRSDHCDYIHMHFRSWREWILYLLQIRKNGYKLLQDLQAPAEKYPYIYSFIRAFFKIKKSKIGFK